MIIFAACSSKNMIMESSRNGTWVFLFKKFIRLNCLIILNNPNRSENFRRIKIIYSLYIYIRMVFSKCFATFILETIISFNSYIALQIQFTLANSSDGTFIIDWFHVLNCFFFLIKDFFNKIKCKRKQNVSSIYI